MFFRPHRVLTGLSVSSCGLHVVNLTLRLHFKALKGIRNSGLQGNARTKLITDEQDGAYSSHLKKQQTHRKTPTTTISLQVDSERSE